MDLKKEIANTYILTREKTKEIVKKLIIISKDIIERKEFKKAISVTFVSLQIISLIFAIYFILVYLSPALQEASLKMVKIEDRVVSVKEKEANKKMKQLEKANKLLSLKLDHKIPNQAYIVVNSSDNKFRLYKGKKIIREGVCSTGSYIMLKAADERKWIFKTPRGVFRIQGKTTYPVWIKPDWAFIEEGLPVPSPTSDLRYEYGVLGDYALSLGQGYLIHGTLYQRFLGLPVTHGCIRLGDDDLKEVYRNLSISSKVFIF